MLSAYRDSGLTEYHTAESIVCTRMVHETLYLLALISDRELGSWILRFHLTITIYGIGHIISGHWYLVVYR